ncbi:hypothetical protein [Blastomonas natatoria]|nr:hypothetical protein [Blastomonas natatoria]
MLHACATSPTDRPSIEPDPLIETRTIVRTVCPPEITAALPMKPQPSADAVINGNEPGMAWLSDTLIYLGLVEGRIHDAKDQCPR